MPTYEYRCPNGHEFEHFFRSISSSESRMKCPECGEEAERIMSGGTGLLFKGSGFYITDYGKDGKKDQRKAAESSKGDSTKSDSTKSDSTKSDSTKSDTSKGESKSGSDSGTKPAADKNPSKGSGSSDS